MKVKTKQQLKNTISINLILLSVFAALCGLLYVTHFIYEIVILMVCVFFVTYLLLGPVEVFESVFEWLLSPLQKFFQIKKAMKTDSVFELIWMRSKQLLVHFLSSYRLFSVVLVMACFVIVVGFGTVRYLPVVSGQVTSFTSELPQYYSKIEVELRQFFGGAENTKALDKFLTNVVATPEFQEAQSELIEQQVVKPINTTKKKKDDDKSSLAESAMGQLILFFQSLASSALSNVFDVITTSLTSFVYFLTGLVLTFYFLLDGTNLKRRLVEGLPDKKQKSADAFLTLTHQLIFGFVLSQILYAVIGGVYLYFIFILFGVKYAGFLSTFFAFASVLPVVGPWLGFMPALMVILFNDPLLVLPVGLLLGCFFLMKEYLLLPTWQGKEVRLHPVPLMVLVLACIHLSGMFGLLLAFPVIAVALVITRGLQQAGWMTAK